MLAPFRIRNEPVVLQICLFPAELFDTNSGNLNWLGSILRRLKTQELSGMYCPQPHKISANTALGPASFEVFSQADRRTVKKCQDRASKSTLLCTPFQAREGRWVVNADLCVGGGFGAVDKMFAVVCSISHVRLSVTPWTVARQASLFEGLSRQEPWRGFHFLLQGLLLTQGWNPVACRRQILYRCPAREAHGPFSPLLMTPVNFKPTGTLRLTLS